MRAKPGSGGGARARRSDPQTSHDAAKRVEVDNLRGRILIVLAPYPEGLVAHEIEDMLDRPRGIRTEGSITPRIIELERMGLVARDCGSRRPTLRDRGANQQIIRITAKGLEVVMGFGLPSQDTNEAAKRQLNGNGRRLANNQRGCDHCTLKADWGKLKTPRMPMSGIPDADILILGEAPGCVSGDTLIDTAFRDKNIYPEGIPVCELVGRSGFYVYSYDVDAEAVVLGNVKRVWRTGIKKVFRVTYEWRYGAKIFRNSLKVTANHPFLLRNPLIWKDPFKGAKSATRYLSIEGGLTVGHSIEPFNRTVFSGRAYIAGASEHYRNEANFLVKQLCSMTGDLPFVNGNAHHENENTLDDTWENLRWLTAADHARHHLADNNPMSSPIHRAAHRRAVNSRDYRTKKSAERIVALASPIVYEHHVQAIISSNPQRSATVKKRFSDPEYYRRYLCGRAPSLGWSEAEIERRFKTKFPVHGDNHKIVAIEPLGYANVYDIEVEKYHNFAANGVFVHNSEEDKLGRPFVGPSGQLLDKILPTRHEARIAKTNALRCRPSGNRDPSAQELHACSIHLETDIAARDIKVILGLGAPALARFLTGTGITAIHGLKFPVEIAGKVLWYYPTLHPAAVLHSAEERGNYEQSPLLPVLENDIRRFFAEVDQWPTPVIERPDPEAVICAHTEAEALYWLDQMDWNTIGNPGHPLGLDIETNTLRPNAQGAAIVSAAVSDGELAVAWPIYHHQAPGCASWGLPLLLDIARGNRWVAHHAGFELAWLTAHAGQAGIADWQPEQGFDDSMAAARLYQKRESCLGLGILTRIYCGTDIKKLSSVNTERIAKEPLPDVLKYNGLDSWGCWRVHRELSPQIDQHHYQAILDTIASVTAMQLVGLDVDRDAAYRLREEWQYQADTAAGLAEQLPAVKRYTTERQREFKIGSADQVGEVLVSYCNVPLPKNRDGSYKTDDPTLTSLAPDQPLALAVLAHRHAVKMDSTYIEPLIKAPTDYQDKRIHPSYSTMLTRTYRLSSETPNIQNFPVRRNRELRRPVVPPEGCLWASADFGQLEARVYAMASRDKELIRSTIAREDIHSYWLNKIIDRYPAYMDRLRHMVTPNDSEAQIRKGGRTLIKSDWTFALLFGSTARNVSDRTGIPYDIAMDLMDDFWQRHYSGARDWLKAQRQQYRDHGMARDLLGRERGGPLTGNECINTPVQGTAAAIVLAAQNELYQLSVATGDPLIAAKLNVHDDLTFSLPATDLDLLEAYIDGISDVLVKVRWDFQIVPLMVEWKIGHNWCDLEPIHEHIGDYVR